jgi:fructose-specific component phosphotransferase system IIB-like protein
MESKTSVSVSKGEEVLILSDSASKISKGFDMVIKQANEAAEKFEEKKKEAPVEIMCKACGEKFKNMNGYKKHLKNATGDCLSKPGFKEVSTVEISPDDRRLGSDAQSISDKSAEATKSLREQANNSSSMNGKKVTVADLVRCPTAALETMLSKADSSEVKKFISMRFHPANASRKIMAEKFLAKQK